MSGVDVSARKTYDLIDEPVDDDYRALLECALSQCDIAVLTVDRSRDAGPGVEEILARLEPHLAGRSDVRETTLYRFTLDKDSIQVLGGVRGLYAWHQPQLPENLSLLRSDGSPWLVSIAAERLGYVELTPFEKLLLGKAAPGLAAVLAHQAARDAILASFERRLEAHIIDLRREMLEYTEQLGDEGRDGIVSAVRDWLTSDEHTRVTIAVGLVGALGLVELEREILDLLQQVRSERRPVPTVYRSNLALRERWKARFERQLRRSLRALEMMTDEQQQ